MRLYIAYNPKFNEEVLGSKYMDNGPYKHKEFRCWYSNPIDINDPIKSDWWMTTKYKLASACDRELSECDIKQMFYDNNAFDEWFWYEKKKMQQDENYFAILDLYAS